MIYEVVTCLCSTLTLELEVNTVPPEERTVRWGAALSQESEAEPRLETRQGRRAAAPSLVRFVQVVISLIGPDGS